MGFGLLLPAALAALAALVLPLLLHLARRSEQRPTPFAALQWLRQRPRPRQRLRFEDWPLLLLRLLLLALLALWLAQPVLRETRAPVRVVAVAPGIDAADLPDADAGFERRWLAEGFPPIDAGPAPRTQASLSSLIRELDADLPADVPLTLIVPAVLDGVDAARLVLGRNVDWRVVPASAPADPASGPAPSAPTLAIRHDGRDPAALRVLRAAAVAWQADDAAGAPDIAMDTTLPAPPVPLAWWRPGTVPQTLRDWVHAGGTVLVPVDTTDLASAAWTPLWHDADGAVVLEAARFGAGRVLRFTRPLAPASLPAVLDGDFPQRLQAALIPGPAPTRVDAAVYVLDRGASRADGARDTVIRDLQPWLALAVALVFLLERWLSAARRRTTRT